MSSLYTRNGSYPSALPQEIALSNGFIRTDPASFTPEEIADAGYVEAPVQPLFDPETEQLGWDGEAWVVSAKPEPPFPILKRKALRSALVSIGIFASDVTTKIGEIEDQATRELAMIDWEDTQEYDRHYPLVDTLAAAFGLPTAQVDMLWRWAGGT